MKPFNALMTKIGYLNNSNLGCHKYFVTSDVTFLWPCYACIVMPFYCEVLFYWLENVIMYISSCTDVK